jgi:hypothetical protein
MARVRIGDWRRWFAIRLAGAMAAIVKKNGGQMQMAEWDRCAQPKKIAIGTGGASKS